MSTGLPQNPITPIRNALHQLHGDVLSVDKWLFEARRILTIGVESTQLGPTSIVWSLRNTAPHGHVWHFSCNGRLAPNYLLKQLSVLKIHFWEAGAVGSNPLTPTSHKKNAALTFWWAAFFCWLEGNWNRTEVHKIAGCDFEQRSEATLPEGRRTGCPPLNPLTPTTFRKKNAAHTFWWAAFFVGGASS